METITLKVEGMTCGHCEKTVEMALRSIAGVKDVKVSRVNESAEVTYKAGKVEHEKLLEVVKKSGYKASLC